MGSFWLRGVRALALLSIFTVFRDVSGAKEGRTCLSGFSSFDSTNGRRFDRDNRQYLVPTMNFTCSGRVTSWKLSLFATNNNDLTPLGSIDLQVWGRDEFDCVFLKEEVTYFQLTERRDQFEVELMDERFSLNFDSGDFIGFFLYEHGLSPTVDVASLNMTVFEIRDRQPQYCNVSLDPDFVRLSQSPMLDLQIKTNTDEVAVTPSLGVNATSSPTPPPLSTLTLSLISALGAVFVAVLVLLVCLVVLVPVVIVQRRKLKTRVKDGFTHKRETTVDKESFVVPEDDMVAAEWSVDWSHIRLGGKLGADHNSEVRPGYIARTRLPPASKHHRFKGNLLPVLIKMVPTESEAAKKSFSAELSLLRMLTNTTNTHVIKLLAILPAHPPAIVIEYSLHGNLLSYLQAYNSTENCTGHSNDRVTPLFNKKVPNAYVSHMKQPGISSSEDVYAEPYALVERIKEGDLISFAQQIASGMEYLSSMNIVHRELACKNVLVTDGKILKIAEFGLARTTEYYVSREGISTGAKWMAPEAIRDRIFTEKSDVWSYGVCVWEICTLGRDPYSFLDEKNILGFLQSGHRLKCPGTCSEEISKMMMDCWKWEPGQRPSFSGLHSYLYRLIEADTSGCGYIKLRDTPAKQADSSDHEYETIYH